MRVAAIIYHKNAYQIYRKEWIDKCVDSILSQTFQQFDILELEYSGGKQSVIPNTCQRPHTFISREFPTFVHGMNYLLDHAFNDLKYDYVFNVNLDDYYSLKRFERQLYFARLGQDIVSSNIAYINESDHILKHLHFDRMDLKKELMHDNNIIAHPVVLYSKKFWDNCVKYIPNEIPREDLNMWKRNLRHFKFYICPEFLCFHRIHSNKVTQSNNR